MQDVLKMATSNPATLMGLDSKVGKIEVGTSASFLLVEQDFSSLEVVNEEVFVAWNEYRLTITHILTSPCTIDAS